VFQKKDNFLILVRKLCNRTSQSHAVLAKYPERNSLLDKGQCVNTAIKYSLFSSWQMNYLKTKSAKSLRQIRGTMKVRTKPAFQH